MGKLIDLTGQRFGLLTVLDRSKTHKIGHGNDAYWLCKCDCGTLVEKNSYALRHSKLPSCGCAARKNTSERCLSIKPNDRFGRLTVIKRATPVGVKPVKWECLCDCGNRKVISASSLKSGATTSCGCIHKEQLARRNSSHGQSNTRLYNIWRGMKSRCNNPNDTQYEHYGELGVRICDEWLHNFQSFYEWAMANGYNPNATRSECTIDRIDPYGNYEPSNCRWVDMKTQQHNKRSNHTDL